MNFKEWLISEYRYTGQGELGGNQSDPFGIKQHGDNLALKGAEGIAQGVGSQLAKTAEKSGAKTGNLGQTGAINIQNNRDGSITLDIYIPVHLATDQRSGRINKAEFDRQAVKTAITMMAKQHNVTEAEVQAMYAFESPTIQINTVMQRNGTSYINGSIRLRRAPKRRQTQQTQQPTPTAAAGATNTSPLGI